MRRNVRRHTDGNSRGAIHQKIRKAGGQNRRLLLRLIEIRHKVDRILVDISQHLHRDLREPCLCIPHGCRAVSVHRSEVSVTVHQRIPHGPLLCHVDQGSVDRGIPVRMEFTHCITDDTRALSVWLVGSVVQLDHRIQDTPLHRFQTVPHVRKRPGGNDRHRIHDVGLLHRLLKIHFPDLVEYFLVHAISLLLSLIRPDYRRALHFPR